MKRTIEGETIADIMTGKPIPLVVYRDDHADSWHTHDVDGHGEHLFRYPALRLMERPEHIYEVSYDDYEDHREDSVFYSKAKATARAEVLNREIHADYVKGFEQARERWALELATRPLTDEDIAFLDACLIADGHTGATEKGIRRAARAVAEAFHRVVRGDPREGLAFCEAEANKTLDEWLADNHASWRVGEVRIDDAREVSDGPTDG